MDRQIRFGIIGAGEIARACISVFKSNPRVRAVAVADVNAEAAKALAAEVGAGRVVGDYRDLLKLSDVEAVYIATPPFLHKPMVLDALAADKHIICEKPFMMDSTQVEEISRAAAAKPALKLASCSSRFLQKAAITARKVVQGGELGRLERVGFIMSNAGAPVFPNWNNWRLDKRQAGGGLLMDWGVYDLDWMSYVMGDQFKPARVVATMGRVRKEVEAIFTAQIFCADGLRIDWQRRGTEHGPGKDVVEFRGSEAGMDVAMVPSEHGPVLYRHKEGKLQRQELDGPWLRDWSSVAAFPIADFADAIAEDREPLSPLSRQLLIQRVTDACYRSAASGQTVELD